MINELITRAKSDKPDFFKKLQLIGAYSAIGGMLILGVVTQVKLPSIIAVIGTVLTSMGTTIAAISQLPNKDANETKNNS